MKLKKQENLNSARKRFYSRLYNTILFSIFCRRGEAYQLGPKEALGEFGLFILVCEREVT